MEVECLALKDLTSPRKSFPMDPEEEEEDGGQSEQKVKTDFSAGSQVRFEQCGRFDVK